MNLAQLLLILKARSRTILITFGVTVFTTIVVSLLLPKSYTATTSLVLNYKGVDPVTGIAVPAQLMPGYMATQTDIISSRNVALKVVNELKLADNADIKDQFIQENAEGGDIHVWLADKLLEKLDVEPSRESSVIALSFTAPDSASAATVANEFAKAYQQTNIQLKIEPAQKAAEYFATQTKALRANLEAAQARLAKYQQDNGLTSGLGTLDVENSRLNDLSSQLVLAQSQSDMSSNPVIQNIKNEISTANSKLTELSHNVGINHPQYQAAQAELESLKRQLQQETTKTASGAGGVAYTYKQRVSELSAALATQKARVLTLNRAKSELSVLQQDIDNAQHALDAANQRFTQTTLEGNANQADVAILNPATPPQKPTSPKIIINTLLSIFLGTMLGIGFALLAEMNDRRVRSREDISELLDIPVFAVIHNEPAHPPGKRPIALFRRLSKPA